MSNIKIKNSNGQWVETTKAINTKLMDLEGNFESKNVEGALRELAQKIANFSGVKVIFSGNDNNEK